MSPGSRPLDADESVSTADTSVSLGLIVTELTINALKHAFPDNRSGKIIVSYRARDGDWTLAVRDNGVGMPADPSNAKAGLGTSIVQALARQLGAKVNLKKEIAGTTVSIVHAHVAVLGEHPIEVPTRLAV